LAFRRETHGVDATVRRPDASDADAMGRAHVRAWQAAYRSIMPDDYLDGLSPDDRASMWRRQIEARGGDGLLVIVADDAVAGFAAFGRCQDDDGSAEVGQLYAINLDPALWGRGLGRALLRAATHELARQGFTRLALWVVPENERARGLYESEGWTTDGTTRDEEVLGVAVTELRYQRHVTSAPGARDWT
jgi:RimJ/RimL family protein N-acetyltransferase